MKPEQFQREKDYGAGIAMAGSLLERGLITAHEYGRLKARLVRRYRPAVGCLSQDSVRYASGTGRLPEG